MQWYHYAMAAAAALVAAAAFRRPRALLWVGLLAASYLVSVVYLHIYEGIEAANVLSVYTADAGGYVQLSRYWLPPSIIAAMCDIAAATVVRFAGRERWEVKWLAGSLFMMAAINIVFAFGVVFGFPPIPEQWVLGVVLEAINILALILIATGGTGIVEWIGARMGARRGGRGLLGRGLAYLRAPARAPLWHR